MKHHLKHVWYQLRTKPEFIFIRYLMVGATNTTVCFLFMAIFASFGFDYLVYTACGYMVAILYSFFMNLHFTFRVNGKIFKRLSLFFIINFSNLGVVEVIEYVLIDKLGWHRFLSIVLAMGWYVVSGFLINNYFIYRRK